MGHQKFDELRVSLLNALRAQTEAAPLRSADAMSAFDSAPGPCHVFCWSRRALRFAALIVAGLTLAALPMIAAEAAVVRALGACWLAFLLALAHVIANRAHSRVPVVKIDALGIADRRLLSRRVYWQDIAAFERADLKKTKVIEFFLTQPNRKVVGQRLGLRFGMWVQRRLDLPAVTINLFLLDASATDIARAVAEFRPGLLPLEMISSLRSSSY